MRTKSFRVAAAALAFAVTASAAQAYCGNATADVYSFCPNPGKWYGPKHLTETSRNMPTVGRPGYYAEYNTRVVLHGQGAGYQDFHWQNRAPAPKPHGYQPAPKPTYTPQPYGYQPAPKPTYAPQPYAYQPAPKPTYAPQPKPVYRQTYDAPAPAPVPAYRPCCKGY
jgi:hypothetical protein